MVLYLESWQDISTSREERLEPALLRCLTTGLRWTRTRLRRRASPLLVAEQEVGGCGDGVWCVVAVVWRNLISRGVVWFGVV